MSVTSSSSRPVYDLSLSFWHRLGEQFGLVALRPKLARDVRVRREGDSIDLEQVSTGRSIPIGDEDVRLLRQFDGTRTIAEMIVQSIGEERRLTIQPLLELVDRVVRAEMLDNFPPNMFRQLDTYLARRAVALARYLREHRPADVLAGAEPTTDPVSQYEQSPWRPRTPLLAERAEFLRKVELFRSLDAVTIGALAEAAHEEAFPAATNIVTEGSPADRFYVVRTGEANVTKRDETGTPRRIARLGPGDYFGEAGLLESAARNASVRAAPSRPVQAYSFDPQVFERIISPHIDRFRGRAAIGKRRARLEQIELFSALNHDEVERLAQAVKEHRVPSGTTVVRQGEEGDRFYIVVEGKVSVLRDDARVAELGPGDFFGETALLFTSERTASVCTDEESVLWSIDKHAFQRMIREQLLGRRDLMPTVMNRLTG